LRRMRIVPTAVCASRAPKYFLIGNPMTIHGASRAPAPPSQRPSPGLPGLKERRGREHAMRGRADYTHSDVSFRVAWLLPMDSLRRQAHKTFYPHCRFVTGKDDTNVPILEIAEAYSVTPFPHTHTRARTRAETHTESKAGSDCPFALESGMASRLNDGREQDMRDCRI
jgi:hypothetical protein